MTSDGGDPVAAPTGTRLLQTLEKGLQLLSLFDVDHQQWSPRELREATGESKTTVLRITKTLESQGYLARDPNGSGKLRLGTSIVKLAYVTFSHGELVRVSEPFMNRLSEMTNETVALTVQVEQGSIALLSAVTPRFLRPYSPIGRIARPVLQTASGKIFVAYGPEDAWDKAIAEAVPLDGHHKETDRQLLRKRLVEAREQGIAFDFAESSSEISGVAAALFGADGRVRATLTVLAPVERFGPAEIPGYVDAIRLVSAELSQELGAPPERIAFVGGQQS